MNYLRQAATLFEQGDLQQAERLYRQVLRQNPDNGGAYWGLGRIAMQALYFEAAIEMFSISSQLLPDEPQPLINLGDAYAEMRHFSEAGKCYKKAVDISPEHAPSHYAYGIYLSEAGRSDDAENLLRKAIAIAPTHGHSYSALVRLKTFKAADDDDIVAMEALLQQGKASDPNRMVLHFALGKAYFDLNEAKTAFMHLEQANSLQHSRVNFSVSDMKPFFQSIQDTFTDSVLQKKNSAVNSTFTPIFIVGQPRSGSSLLEQMLGCHSDITALGELPYIGREVAAALNRTTQDHFPQACARLNQNQIQQLAHVYHDAIRGSAPNSKFVTDKLPANYQSIGLINMLMPQAKVINIRRHPMDMGFSIYRNFFDQKEPYFCDMGEIGAYHRIYEDMMSFWHRALPGYIHDVRYEDLVKNPKKVVGEILRFCDLEWQDSCLEFHKNRRHVQTLSDAQVNEKIHSKGVGRWKEYENYLEPLKNALGDSIENYS